jgi:glycosyltransferase involved in cell wall biosynthesis
MSDHPASKSELSSVMIVQDEIEFLVQAIAALKKYSDQLIFVDLGSTDGSCQFMRHQLRRQDRVIELPWSVLYEKGFSYVRNCGSRAADGQWIEHIDADEMLLPNCVESIKPSLRNSEKNILSITRLELEKNPTVQTTWWPDVAAASSPKDSSHRRICRNDPKIRWEGYIHEELWEGEQSGYFTAEKSILTYWHFSTYRTSYKPSFKNEKYAWMLLRAESRPELRFGINDGWFNKYIPAHRAGMEIAANNFEIWLNAHGVSDLSWRPT